MLGLKSFTWKGPQIYIITGEWITWIYGKYHDIRKRLGCVLAWFCYQFIVHRFGGNLHMFFWVASPAQGAIIWLFQSQWSDRETIWLNRSPGDHNDARTPVQWTHVQQTVVMKPVVPRTVVQRAYVQSDICTTMKYKPLYFFECLSSPDTKLLRSTVNAIR